MFNLLKGGLCNPLDKEVLLSTVWYHPKARFFCHLKTLFTGELALEALKQWWIKFSFDCEVLTTGISDFGPNFCPLTSWYKISAFGEVWFVNAEANKFSLFLKAFYSIVSTVYPCLSTASKCVSPRQEIELAYNSNIHDSTWNSKTLLILVFFSHMPLQA